MAKIRIHYFQHAAFEGLGNIEEWVTLKGHLLTSTLFHEEVSFPDHGDIDWLIVMGGPMSVHDEDQYDWLKAEKQFIRQAIGSGKTVLGICLGSQLVAEALGARVYQNKEKEIGWFDIELSPSGKASRFFFDMNPLMKVFHWHGDTFDIPKDAYHIASSRATRNQGYIYKERVVALQFHPEITTNSLSQMLEDCESDLTPGKYVQTAGDILNGSGYIEHSRKILFSLLDRLAGNK